MNLRRLLYRSLKYFKKGSALISIPFSILGVASSFYTLVKVIQWDKMLELFPTFERFIYISVPIYFVGSGIVGYLYLKSAFYTSGDRDVDMLRDPMHISRYSPLASLSMSAVIGHYKGYIDPVVMQNLEAIIEESKEYWKSRGVKMY